MEQQIDLEIDLAGFVSFMRNLFGNRTVFLRELVQNAFEAINQAKHLSAIAHGTINIRTNRRSREIEIFDDGCGMTSDELKNNLGRVFKSGWPETPGETLGIGQFGFGFFSTILVADEVRVKSRARKQPGTSGWEWVFDLKKKAITLSESKMELRFGTQITLSLRDDSLEFLEHENIVFELRRLFLFCSSQIHVNDEKSGIQHQEEWRRSLLNDRSREQHRAEAKIRHGWNGNPTVIYTTEEGVLAGGPKFERTPGVSIYRRGVFVAEKELIPPPLNGAFCGFFNVDQLNLRPDRENFRDDEHLGAFRERLLKYCSDAFLDTAKWEPQYLSEFVSWNREEITKAFLLYPAFIDVGPCIPMRAIIRGEQRTDQGTTWSALAKRAANNCVTITTDSSRDSLLIDRYNTLGTAVLVVDDDDMRLARRLAEVTGTTLRHITEAYISELEATERDERMLKQLFAEAAEFEGRILCAVDIDTRAPVRFLSNETESNSDMLGFASRDDVATHEPVLFVNLENPVVLAMLNSVSEYGILEPHRKIASMICFAAKLVGQIVVDGEQFRIFSGNMETMLETHLKTMNRGEA